MRLSLACAFVLCSAATCGSGDERTAHGDPAAGKGAALTPDYGTEFGKHWYDGRAELAGYELTYPRYGSPRAGTAVTIFVTEPQLRDARVKPNDPADADFTVLKLNLVQDFATGIYDYNVMTSAFVALSPVEGRPPGAASKVSFSAQEWCGQVYAQLVFRPGEAQLDSHSYFEGEADQRRALSLAQPALSEDALWLWARGLAWPKVAPGQTLRVELVDSLEHARLAHRSLGVGHAVLEVVEGTQRRSVPAGEFDVTIRHAEVVRSDGSKVRYEFAVERASPHRIVEVSRDDGYRALMTGSMRVAYWEKNGPGNEALLEQLGLHPRPPRTPQEFMK